MSVGADNQYGVRYPLPEKNLLALEPQALKKTVITRRRLLSAMCVGFCNTTSARTETGPAGVLPELQSESSITDSKAPRTLTERIEALRVDASRIDRLRSLVVLHEGRTVLAEAFSGPSVDTAVNVKSVSKSLVASLVGCAIERQVIPDVSMTLGDAIPDLIPSNADPRVAVLTVANLLTMQAGLQRTSGPFYGTWVASDDWVKYVLSRRFVDEPGGRMLYSTGDWHVLGALLSKLSDASLLELSREWLGKPLDIDFAPWTRDPQGLFMGGNEMSLSPLHMAKFGELYRLQGIWNDQQVLQSKWVQQSFTARTHSPFSGDDYGYGWFLRRVGTSGFAYARGYGGQFIHVLPFEGITVAMTSDWTRSARGGVYTEQLHKLVSSHLLQA